MEKGFLIQSHMSRLAIILTKMATVLFIFGIIIYSMPILLGLGSIFLVLFAFVALLIWALAGLLSLGFLFTNSSYRSFGKKTTDFIGNVAENSSEYIEFFGKLHKYSPAFLIPCCILFVISLVLFFFSRRLKRSKTGLIFTSIFLGIFIILVLAVFIGLSMVVKSNE